MKTRNILIQLVIIACSGLLFQGCQKEEPEGLVTLKAVVSDDYGHHAGSKTYIRGKFVYWDNGDSININGTPFKIDITTGETETTATIEGVPESGSGYVAVYPARFVTTPASVTASSTSVAVKIPSILYMKPGERQNTQGLMVAKTAAGGNTLSFHHAGSVLALQVTNGFTNEADLKLYRIKVASSTSGLSGPGTLTIDGSAPSYSITGSGTLTLDMENDTITHNASKIYYIPIPPQTGTQFTITIYATNGDNHYVFTRNSNSGLTVYRNQQVSVPVEMNATSGYIETTTGGNGLMGSGTAADPYVIATLTDLIYFRDQVNGGNTYSSKYIRQTADIDASVSGTVDWTPIGTSSNKFQGTYDGGGHTTTIKMNPTTSTYGYFGYINNASIKNITIDGTCTGNTYQYIGGICGNASNGTNFFYNCINQIDINGNKYIGGIVGEMGNGKIDKFKNTGKLTSKKTNDDSYVGGIGAYSNGKNIKVTNCTNRGNITSKGYIAGGIFGDMRSPVNGTIINNCYSYGTIESTRYAAGIAFCYPYSSSYKLTISNCYLNGLLKSATNRSSILYEHNSNYCTVSNCYANSDCKNTSSSNYVKNATTTFTTLSGSLTTPQTINTVSCSTLYDALHNWQLLNTTYSDWKKETIPHLAWEN